MRSALATAITVLALTLGSWAVALPARAADPAPTTISVSADSFRPVPDGVQDTITITATVDPAVPTVVVSVEPGIASWTLTPDPTTHQVSVVWNGTRMGGSGGLVGPGRVTISANAWGYTGPGLLVGTAVTTVMSLIDTVPQTAVFHLTGQDALVKSINGRCGRLAKPSAHRWRRSVGFYADARCNKGGASNTTDGLYAIRPYDTQGGHPVHEFTTVQISVYGAAAPGSYRHSVGLLATRTRWGKVDGYSLTKLSPNLGWHAGRTVDASEVMSSDHSFAWDVGTVKHARYDVKAFQITVGYDYQY